MKVQLLIITIFLATSGLAAQTPVLTIPSGHGQSVDAFAISKDNQMMISGDNASSIKIWRLIDGLLMSTLDLGLSYVENIQISDDKSNALISCDKGYAIINTIEGRILYSEKISTDFDEIKFGYARINPNNNLIYYSVKLSSGDIEIFTMDMQTFVKKKIAVDKIDVNKYFYGCRMSFHPKNTHVLLDYNHNSTVLLDLKTNTISSDFNKKNHYYFYNDIGQIVEMRNDISGFDLLENVTIKVLKSIAIEPSENKERSYGNPFKMTNKGLVLHRNNKFWIYSKGNPIPTTLGELKLTKQSKYCISPDLSLLAFVPHESNNKIFLYSVKSGQFIRPLGVSTFTPEDIEASHDAKEFWLTSKDKTFKYMKLVDSKLQLKTLEGKRNGQGSIAASFDKGLLFANERENFIVHNLKDGSQRKISIPKDKVSVRDFDLMSTYASADGKRLVSINDNTIDIYDTENNRFIGSIILESGLSSFGACFSPDNQTVFVGGFFKFEGKGREYKVGAWSLNNLDKPIWMVDAHVCALQYDVKNNAIAFVDLRSEAKAKWLNPKTGMEVDGFLLQNFPWGTDARGKLEKDGQHVTASSQNYFMHWSKSTSYKKLFKPDDSYVDGEYGTFANNKFLYLTNNEYIEIYSSVNAKAIAKLYLFEGSDDYVIIANDGRFDGTSEAISKLYYVMSSEIISLESISEKFFTPGLLGTLLFEYENEIVANDEREPNNEIEKLKSPPTVKMSIKEGTRNLVVADDEPNIYVSKSEKVSVVVEASCPDDGVSEIRLYHNGKLVGGNIRNLVVEDEKTAPKNDSRSFEITLLAGNNTLKAIALNTQRTESAPYAQLVSFKPSEQPSQTTSTSSSIDLYVVVVGINAYKNTKYNLNYAVADALAFKESIEKGVVGLFGNVNVALVNDAQATKEAINKEFQNVLNKSKKEDVFIFYYAGHGVMSGDNKNFYLVPHDVTQLYGNDGALSQKGFSAKELQDYSANIKAQKQLFILDACQSAGALEQVVAARGAAEEKAIAQLARATGTHWLTASGSQQFASEFKQLGHGTFTYCIIEALSGKADTGDKKVSVKELDAYLQEQVPEVTAKYKGTPQYPASYGFGNDFPIIMVN